jgi:ABC-type Zn2+ transport system substrate-binding protein/surface adhesin
MHSAEQLYVCMAEVIALAMDHLMGDNNANGMADRMVYEAMDAVADKNKVKALEERAGKEAEEEAEEEEAEKKADENVDKMANKKGDEEIDARGTNLHTTNSSFILQKIAEFENALKIKKPITQMPSEKMLE